MASVDPGQVGELAIRLACGIALNGPAPALGADRVARAGSSQVARLSIRLACGIALNGPRRRWAQIAWLAPVPGRSPGGRFGSPAALPGWGSRQRFRHSIGNAARRLAATRQTRLAYGIASSKSRPGSGIPRHPG